MHELVILGPPRTKKTSNRVMRFGNRMRIMPSAAFVEWQDLAVPQLRCAWRGRRPLSIPVCIRATFFRDATRGDLLGYMQALADVLEVAGIVDNDRLIQSWDGTRLAKDAERPRVEVIIGAAP